MVDYREAHSVGDRVQAARKARGIRSTKALADLIDNGSVSEATLQNIETGRLTNISLSQLLNIAYALKVAPSFLLAPLGKRAAPLDLPNLTSGLSSMTSAEFDAWFSGSNTGGYRPSTAPEMAERNELAALRDLENLSREKVRLQALKDLQAEEPADAASWNRDADRLAVIERNINEITDYLVSAGWPFQEK